MVLRLSVSSTEPKVIGSNPIGCNDLRHMVPQVYPGTFEGFFVSPIDSSFEEFYLALLRHFERFRGHSAFELSPRMNAA